jgi:hypothetical protein
MDTKKEKKEKPIFTCLKCNFTSSVKFHYERHLTTVKHIKDTKMIHFLNNSINLNFKCVCGKQYKYSQGLSKHKKICDYKPITEVTRIEPNINMFIDLIKENQEIKKLLLEQNKQLLEQNSKVSDQNNKLTEQNNQVIELHKENNILINKLVEKESITTINNTTNNNQKFNLNFFLNETCKDAMNLKEFIDNIIVSFEELLTIGNTGFVNGVSEIVIKRLKELEITKRPIHCTDIKREIIYLKNDDKWNKDDNNNKNLKDAIEKVEYKNIYSLREWCNENPDAYKSNTENNDLWLKIYEQTIQGSEDTRDRVVKNISKKVSIVKE